MMDAHKTKTSSLILTVAMFDSRMRSDGELSTRDAHAFSEAIEELDRRIPIPLDRKPGEGGEKCRHATTEYRDRFEYCSICGADAETLTFDRAIAAAQIPGELLGAPAERAKSWELLAELAWGLIANAHGGNWDLASPDWKRAAERWRDDWHAALKARNPAPAAESSEWVTLGELKPGECFETTKAGKRRKR